MSIIAQILQKSSGYSENSVKPVLYVWKDINGEDPVRIDLDGALESARREPLEV